MIEDKRTNKEYIKKTLGTRNYFSYKIDLILYKIAICFTVFMIFFLRSGDINFSLLISAEVFLILTLVNKLRINRKRNEGKEQLILEAKMEHFKNKIDEINPTDFEMLIGYLYEKKGFKNFLKKGKHMYLAEKNGLINCIKIFKFCDEIELDKIDLRGLITYMLQNNIRLGHIITTGNLSEEAKEFLKKFEGKLDLTIVDLNQLFLIMDEYNILPEEDYFDGKVIEKCKTKQKVDIRGNVFNSKKILVYIFAAVFFNISSTLMPSNGISKYISYYFILLTIVSVFYIIWMKYISNEVKS